MGRKTDSDYFSTFILIAERMLSASQELDRLCRGSPSGKDAVRRIKTECEDMILAAEERLFSEFIPPIPREDIALLLEALCAAVREMNRAAEKLIVSGCAFMGGDTAAMCLELSGCCAGLRAVFEAMRDMKRVKKSVLKTISEVGRHRENAEEAFARAERRRGAPGAPETVREACRLLLACCRKCDLVSRAALCAIMKSI